MNNNEYLQDWVQYKHTHSHDFNCPVSQLVASTMFTLQNQNKTHVLKWINIFIFKCEIKYNVLFYKCEISAVGKKENLVFHPHAHD